MDGNGCRQPLQIIAAFQNGHNAALGMGVGGAHEFQRGPGEIFFAQLQAAQRIGVVGIEARRDEHQIRGEIIKGGQDDAAHGVAELHAAIACPERRIENVADAGFIAGARTGIKRHLVGGAIEQVGIGPEDFLGAVAVVHIEIDDGHALRIIAAAGIVGGDGHLIEQAEAHGLP